MCVCVCVCAYACVTMQTHPLQVKILRHALASSHNDNQNLRSRLAKIQMASLPPLHLLPVAEGKREKEDASKQDWNQTDQEKAVAKQVSSLRKVSMLGVVLCIDAMR